MPGKGSHLTPEHQSAAGKARWKRATPEHHIKRLRAAGNGMLRKADAIEAAVAAWPTPTPEQIELLRELLPPVEGDAGD